MLVDEGVDDALVIRGDALELHAHSNLAIAPRHLAGGVDFRGRSGQLETHLNRRAFWQGIHRPNREPALADVERHRAGKRVSTAICHGHADRHPRAHAPVEAVREEVRRESGQNERRARVLVDVTDLHRGEGRHVGRRSDGSGEHDHRKRLGTRRPDGPHEVDGVG